MNRLDEANTPTIWMNVTTSANWTRPAVGIVRVERELCQELSKLYPRHQFRQCVFQNGEFVPFNPEHSTTSPAPATYSSPPPPLNLPRFPRSSTFEAAFGRIRAVARGLKTPARTATPAPLSPPQPKLSQPREVLPAQPEPGIRYGDILLSVGLDWDHSYTNQFQKLKEGRGIHIVTCCYDLIPVLFPQYCVGRVASLFKSYFTKLSWASSLVLCISERSRDDYLELVKMIGAPEPDTLVMPLGDHVPKIAKATPGDASADDGDVSPEVARAAERPFILFVSTIERRKNHEVLYRAYHLLARAGHADRLPQLIFVGMPGWGVGDLLKDIEFDPLTQGLITQLNHVSDSDLAWLYEKAYLCVFPSLYEGWGLPIGEALACGKAVLASGRGSIPEVGGDLVTYLDPWNPQAWADEILALVDNPGRVEAMEAAVREHYTPRTWRSTALAVKSGLDKLRARRPVSVKLDPGYDLSSTVGIAWGEELRSHGASGLLTWGPHRALPSGVFQITIHWREFDGAEGEMLFKFCSSLGKKVHKSVKVALHGSEGPERIQTLSVTLNEPIDDYEIITHVPARALVSITRVEIRELKDNQSTDVPFIES